MLRRSHPRRSRAGGRAIAGIAAVFGLSVAACTSGNEPATPTTVPVTTVVVEPDPNIDGRLTIGFLLPVNDPILGQGLVSAAATAVDRINDAGGVLGQDVVVEIADEGTTDASARDGIAQLIDADVDAVVGPSSSLVALSTLDDLVSAGLLSCSPTATAIALDGFPDDRLFFRTVPSDSLQAVAIADVAERTGFQDVAVVYVDDAYGRPFARAVEAAFAEGSRSITNVETFPFARADGSLDQLAQEVTESGARVLIVLAGADDASAFLEALNRTNFQTLREVILNDAIRNPSTQPLIETLDPALRAIIRGVAPQAQSNDEERPFDPPGLFATNAFDCVNLIALAAALVKSDDPAVFKRQIPALTTGGRSCTSFETCVAELEEGLDINYNGPDGITEMLQVGDPARARFDTFGFDETGRSVYLTSNISSSI